MKGAENTGCLTWAYIGDLHFTGNVDSCVMPGDNTEDGSAAQYASIRRGLDGLNILFHAIPGDPDRNS